MSEATERPAADPDPDAWATACAEDLEAEKARRRAAYGPPPGSAAEELRKLVDAVADKVSSLQNPLFGMAAQGAVQQFVQQAKAVVEPVIERNPDVFDHLAAAGGELLAAYRSAVEGQEARWTRGDAPEPAAGTRASDDPSDPRGDSAGRPGPEGNGEGPASDGHIDLD
ncbi:DUF5304 domain-containing protein [Streptomyces corynorhini]|uniref:DUF5304 domain-containing protein n=1 Tax=Streptomyces corynorhini TaxID=2282652 RepID=A0A370BE89_9ACTN|nr:DUF5304 domain-containing protein [Streptomyces corynorhini]RDG38133.1 hypothetical protein DVH02_10600 [Streptomyces corynorhini]